MVRQGLALPRDRADLAVSRLIEDLAARPPPGRGASAGAVRRRARRLGAPLQVYGDALAASPARESGGGAWNGAPGAG